MYIRKIIPALVLGLILTSCGGTADSSSKNTDSGAKKTTSSAAQSKADSQPEVKSPLGDMGLTKDMFDSVLTDITTNITDTTVTQSGSVNGYPYTLTIELKNWTGCTSPSQIVTLSRLYWQCYPAMFERFGVISKASRDVTFIVDINYDDDVAGTQRDVIYLQDKWLGDNPDDYDCMTHELAHVIQNIWNEDYLEYSSYIERFADYCRYVYALDGGKYNDTCWRLQDVFGEDSREASVRFLVWLDYTYSGKDNDLLSKIFTVCYNKEYPADDWDSAWAHILEGSPLEGRSIDDVWDMYAQSDFAVYDSAAEPDSKSQLTVNFDIREKLKA